MGGVATNTPFYQSLNENVQISLNSKRLSFESKISLKPLPIEISEARVLA